MHCSSGIPGETFRNQERVLCFLLLASSLVFGTRVFFPEQPGISCTLVVEWRPVAPVA